MTSIPLRPCLLLEDALEQVWDVVVIGAGPAGAVAARQTAAAGLRTLLVDKAMFPRDKVCGCCLNGSALAALEHLGLGNLPERLGALRLERWRLATPRRGVTISLPAGVSLSRAALDAGLIDEAVRRGAAFLPETRATLGPPRGGHRAVRLSQRAGSGDISARLIIGASGLASRPWQGESGLVSRPRKGARIGVGAVLPPGRCDLEPDTIHMAYARDGYVGLVCLEDGRMDIAGAVNRSAAKQVGGPGPLVLAILRRAGMLPADLPPAGVWRGTPPLTRRPQRVHGERVLLVGDAAGYVEPFTGEGMAWALWSGAIAAPLAVRAVEAWEAGIGREWSRRHACTIRPRQIVCRRVVGLLRQPLAAECAARALALFPWSLNPILRFVNAPPRHRSGAWSDSG